MCDITINLQDKLSNPLKLGKSLTRCFSHLNNLIKEKNQTISDDVFWIEYDEQKINFGYRFNPKIQKGIYFPKLSITTQTSIDEQVALLQKGIYCACHDYNILHQVQVGGIFDRRLNCYLSYSYKGDNFKYHLYRF